MGFLPIHFHRGGSRAHTSCLAIPFRVRALREQEDDQAAYSIRELALPKQPIPMYPARAVS